MLLSIKIIFFAFQEVFNQVQGVPVEAPHRFSTTAAGFSAGVVGGVNSGQRSSSGRAGAKRDPKDWPRRLFSGHARLLNQDDSTKSAENGKKKDTKPYKQVVTADACSLALRVGGFFPLCHAEMLRFSSATERERGRCPSVGWAGWSISEVSGVIASVRSVDTFSFFPPFVSELMLFAGLAIGLGIGAIAEVAKKNLKPQKPGDERIPALLPC